jgi:lipid-A-disaccharide synthase
LRPTVAEPKRAAGTPLLLVLPGSRPSEIRRLAGIFGDTLGLIANRAGEIDVVLPTLPHVAAQVTAATTSWPVRPRIVVAPDEKYSAFSRARAALTASGTVTLELALAQVPMVAAYRVQAWEGALFRMMAHINTVILANLVLGENVVPEFLQRNCTPEQLAKALVLLLHDTEGRRRQLQAFARLDRIMDLSGEPPSTRAARAVLALIERKTALPSPPASC